MDAHEFAIHPPDAVINQSPPLENYNLLAEDLPLREALRREGAGWIEERAFEFGELLGKSETLRLGELANRYTPLLRTHDRFGHRIDEVEFHPAWHEQMRLGIEFETHSLAWTSKQPGAHVARVVLDMLRHQIDEGPSCPITMTFAVIPTLRLGPELAAEWESKALSNEYDQRFIPADKKRGVLFGMAMTERQGGSDVRANTTRAEPLAGGTDGEYLLTGHKWFCSAPMCDAFLALAQTKAGLSCFFLPRWKPDQTCNGFHIMRLKDKLGNRSNASSEIEFRGAWARMIGEEGRGVATIMEMVRHTRLDCVCGSAATLRRAVAEATHHAAHRHAFGRRLIDQPLMKNVLADLCLESEAATALALRLARSFDDSAEDEQQGRFARIATAIGKYWVTKRALLGVAEALECLGGNGYVEEGPMARLYRDAPLNSLWEGAGNVQCLDVLRVINKDPDTLEVLRQELCRAQGADRRYDTFLKEIEGELSDLDRLETRSRRIVAMLAIALQGSILVQHAPSPVADAFCASRLDGNGFGFGALPAATDFDTIIERARPRL